MSKIIDFAMAVDDEIQRTKIDIENNRHMIMELESQLSREKQRTKEVAQMLISALQELTREEI